MTTTAPEPTLPEVASRLRNGAWVLAAKDAGRGWAIVLGAHLSAGAVMPFCIWKLELETGNAFWGDYYEGIEAACLAYEERA